MKRLLTLAAILAALGLPLADDRFYGDLGGAGAD